MSTIASLIIQRHSIYRGDAGGRVCLRCRVWKQSAEFHIHNAATGLLRSQCRACLCEKKRAHYAANPLMAQKYARQYRATAGQRATFENRKCKTCDTTFRFYSALEKSRDGQGKFCSMACRAAAGRVIYTCQKCAASFSHWRSVPRRFCSLECAGKRTKVTALSDGHLLYSSSWWRRTIRKRIILRDGGECQRCRSSFDLIVHHIVPWIVSRDNSDANLITVCRPCHLRIHGLAKSSDFVPVEV
jgi:5-methylcytosine-specific restriction endonuclease McrA